jgi:predicted transcriptional regulator
MMKGFENSMEAVNFHCYIARIITRTNTLYMTASKYREECEEQGIKPNVGDFKIACELSGVDLAINEW